MFICSSALPQTLGSDSRLCGTARAGMPTNRTTDMLRERGDLAPETAAPARPAARRNAGEGLGGFFDAPLKPGPGALPSRGGVQRRGLGGARANAALAGFRERAARSLACGRTRAGCTNYLPSDLSISRSEPRWKSERRFRALALSWAIKIKKRLKPVTPFLGKFRPVVGQCCHQCTPKSLGWKLLKTSPSLGFQNLLAVNETHTRYRGWLVRRVCCVLFVGGCRVYPSSASGRADRVWASRRVQNALTLSDGVSEQNGRQLPRLTTRGRAAHILPVVDTCISPLLLRVTSWLLLKLLSSVFCSVQVNLSQLTALHKASEMEAPLVFVSVPQCGLDYALVPLALLCHNLRVPYTVCPLWMGNTWLRSVLRRLGVILLPAPSAAEQDAERDSLHGPVMTSLVGELLREGQSVSVTLSPGSGRGGQWLARVWEAVRDGAVPDVSLVPVSVAYDRPRPRRPRTGPSRRGVAYRSVTGASDIIAALLPRRRE
ncbi:hypothetical protein ANANG_G00189570 [Anguilla anguilla]|uniref:Phospholipid/glycerol acyltransferase domain-containing protein n=1 Tax=Anguilla anguilla TaxID=7936 RepID=A0A9D3RRU9_ANGAN|nr:hypothetical protein ANANG_G00189570 [Anguilla anguilla]